MREHLSRSPDDDADLLDPVQAFTTMRESALRLDAWYDGGRRGERPPGRLRQRAPQTQSRAKHLLAAPLYRTVVDPDGRPLRKRLTRRY